MDTDIEEDIDTNKEEIDYYQLDVYLDDLLMHFDECIRDLWDNFFLPYAKDIYNDKLLDKLDENSYIDFYKLMINKNEVYSDIVRMKKYIKEYIKS